MSYCIYNITKYIKLVKNYFTFLHKFLLRIISFHLSNLIGQSLVLSLLLLWTIHMTSYESRVVFARECSFCQVFKAPTQRLPVAALQLLLISTTNCFFVTIEAFATIVHVILFLILQYDFVYIDHIFLKWHNGEAHPLNFWSKTRIFRAGPPP